MKGHALCARSSSKLLLWANISVMSALSLAAVNSLLWEIGVTLSANHLFALELSSESGERWLDLAGA